MERFAAEFKYGTPRLCRIVIRKANDKEIWIDNVVPILGQPCLGIREVKEGLHLFGDKMSALDWLRAQAEIRREELLEDLRKTKDTIISLKALVSIEPKR